MKWDDIANPNADQRETEMLGGLFVVAGIGLALLAVAWAWWMA